MSRQVARARLLCDAARLDANCDTSDAASLATEAEELLARVEVLAAEGCLCAEDVNAIGVAKRVLQRVVSLTSSAPPPDASTQ